MFISFKMEKLTLISALFCSFKLLAETFNSRGGGTKDFWYPLSIATFVQFASSDLSSQSLMLSHLQVMGIQRPLAQLNLSPAQHSFALQCFYAFNWWSSSKNLPSQELRESWEEYCCVLQPMSPVMVHILTPITKLYIIQSYQIILTR